jgi:hypothetical protein
MESVEYLREQTTKAINALNEAHACIVRINDIPRTRITKDLLRGAAPGMTAEDVDKMLGVIDRNRKGAAHKFSELMGDVESLHAALDDAVGQTGRLV